MTDAASDEDDIAASVRAAFSEAAEAEPAQASIPERETPTPDPREAPASEGPARTPDGKFAKQGEAVQDSTNDQPEPTQEPQTGTILPPTTWSATAKAQFATLDPLIQQEVLRREKNMEEGKAQWDQKAGKFNQYEQAFAPYRDKLALRGMDEVQGLKFLLNAQEILDRNPVDGLVKLAATYGITSAHLAQALGHQQPQQQAQLPPEIQQIVQRQATLEQQLAQQQQAAAAQQDQAFQSEIQAFIAKPEHMYFENVKGDMVMFLKSGRAETLDQAYDMACNADPEIRKLVQASHAGASVQQSRAKADLARKAGGSITGAPGPGSTPATDASSQSASIEDDVRKAFASMRA